MTKDQQVLQDLKGQPATDQVLQGLKVRLDSLAPKGQLVVEDEEVLLASKGQLDLLDLKVQPVSLAPKAQPVSRDPKA